MPSLIVRVKYVDILAVFQALIASIDSHRYSIALVGTFAQMHK